MSLKTNSEKLQKEARKVEQEFEDVWRTIVDDVLDDLRQKFSDVPICVNRIKQIIERNVPFGKKARGYLGIGLYRALKQERSEEDDFLNYVSGWMIEIIQAAALMADDIMDDSETRRGMPCWHRNPDVGIHAINDVFMLMHVSSNIAHKYFQDKNYYMPLQELSITTEMRTVLGQSLDMRLATAPGWQRSNFNRFTDANYKAQVKYKTSYYTFHGPVANAAIRAGLTDPTCLVAIEDLTLRMGELFQIQDDFLDCYGDPEETGKVGTDIREGKMSWLIVKALERSSKSQLQDLQEHYGHGGKAEYKVKNIYSDLGLEDIFYKHEEAELESMLNMVKSLPPCIPHEHFTNALLALHRRRK